MTRHSFILGSLIAWLVVEGIGFLVCFVSRDEYRPSKKYSDDLLGIALAFVWILCVVFVYYGGVR